LYSDFNGVLGRNVVQGIERLPLGLGERREGRRTWSGRRARDTRSGAIDEGTAGFLLWEDDRALIESLVRRGACRF